MAEHQQTIQKSSLSLMSSAFAQGESIPSKYTCDGANVSPPLQWNKVPAEAHSLAFIVDDPDASKKTWVHWVIFNLPAGATSVAEDIPKKDRLPNGAIQGRNDFGEVGYGGPCPPSGAHRYLFHLYVLDRQLDLDSSATKDTVMKAMQGHIVAQDEFMGTYTRVK